MTEQQDMFQNGKVKITIAKMLGPTVHDKSSISGAKVTGSKKRRSKDQRLNERLRLHQCYVGSHLDETFSIMTVLF